MGSEHMGAGGSLSPCFDDCNAEIWVICDRFLSRGSFFAGMVDISCKNTGFSIEKWRTSIYNNSNIRTADRQKKLCLRL